MPARISIRPRGDLAFIMVFVANGVVSLASLVRGKIVAVNGGPSVFGDYAVAWTYVGAICTIASLNLGIGVAKLAASNINELDSGRLAAIEVIIALASIPIALAIGCWTVHYCGAEPTYFWWTVSGGWSGVVCYIVGSELQGRGRFQRYSMVQALCALASVALVLLASRMSGEAAAASAISSPNLLAAVGLVSVCGLRRPVCDAATLKLAMSMLRVCIPFAVAGVTYQLFLAGARSAITTSEPVGGAQVMAAWMAAASLMSLVSVPLTKVAMTRFRRAHVESRKAFAAELRLVMLRAGCVMLGVTFAIDLLSRHLVRAMYSEEFDQAAILLRSMAGAEMLRSLLALVHVAMIASDDQKLQLRTELVWCLVVSCCMVCARWMDASWADALVIASTLASLLCVCFVKWRWHPAKKAFRPLELGGIAVVAVLQYALSRALSPAGY